jgi:hypothetical protein
MWWAWWCVCVWNVVAKRPRASQQFVGELRRVGSNGQQRPLVFVVHNPLCIPPRRRLCPTSPHTIQRPMLARTSTRVPTTAGRRSVAAAAVPKPLREG